MLRFFFTGSSTLPRDSSLSIQSVSLRFRLLLAGSVRKLVRGGWLGVPDVPDDVAKLSSWFTPEGRESRQLCHEIGRLRADVYNMCLKVVAGEEGV